MWEKLWSYKYMIFGTALLLLAILAIYCFIIPDKHYFLQNSDEVHE